MSDDREIINKLKNNRSRLPSTRIMRAGDVGSFLKQTRKEIGLTQEEVALISSGATGGSSCYQRYMGSRIRGIEFRVPQGQIGQAGNRET